MFKYFVLRTGREDKGNEREVIFSVAKLKNLMKFPQGCHPREGGDPSHKDSNYKER
jgi:hypothetical protein